MGFNSWFKGLTCFFTVSFQTHVSQPYVTVGLMILQYSFNFFFLETSLLLKEHWLALYTCTFTFYDITNETVLLIGSIAVYM